MKLRQSEWPAVCFRYPAQTRNNTERFFRHAAVFVGGEIDCSERPRWQTKYCLLNIYFHYQ